MIKKIFSVLTAVVLLASCQNSPAKKQPDPEKRGISTSRYGGEC